MAERLDVQGGGTWFIVEMFFLLSFFSNLPGVSSRRSSSVVSCPFSLVLSPGYAIVGVQCFCFSGVISFGVVQRGNLLF